MLRKWICLLWALGLVMGTGEQAWAAEHTGSIRVLPQWCGTPVFGGMVSVCRVGTRTERGLILTDGLADWVLKEGELEVQDWVHWLAQKEFEQKMVRPVREEGALFEDLTAGVYLVRHEESDERMSVFEPFFLTVPEGENWDIYRAPKIIDQKEPPKTGDRPTPLIGAMGIGLSVAFLIVFVDEHRK